MTEDESLARTIGRQERTLDLQLEWIRAVDTKTPIIMAVATAMIGVLFALAPTPDKFTFTAGLWLTLGAACLTGTNLLCAWATFPNTNGPAGSLIFFDGIGKLSAEQYAARATAMSAQEYLDDLLKQCHRNAQIACEKFGHTKRALAWMYGGIVPWLIAVYALYKS